MRIFRSFANPVQMPSFDAVDAGTGGGAGAGAAGGQGGGQGAAGTGGGAAGTGGSGGGSPIELSDSTPIIVGGKQTTWGEHRAASFVPKSDYDNVRKLTQAEITNNLRQLAIKMQGQNKQRPNGQQQQPQGRVDPFAKVRDLPLVDGNTLAQLAEQGFGEVGQTIQQQQQAIHQLAGMIKKLQGGVGTLAKERSGQERQSRLTAAITSLGEGYDAKDEFLQDIAQDVLDAWEFEKPDEFPQMFAKRIQAAEKWVRARDAAKLKAAKERRFVRPGGGATPSGGARPDPRMAASQAADMLFGPRNGANAT